MVAAGYEGGLYTEGEGGASAMRPNNGQEYAPAIILLLLFWSTLGHVPVFCRGAGM